MIQKNTLRFLSELEKNNNREWFAENKEAYEKAKDDFTDLVQKIIDSISKFDPSLKDLKAKNCVFRIYRDVRFSKNKMPYKTYFGASFSAGGKKSNLAGYYLHIEDKNSFLAGGKWMPEAADLAAIRQEIDYNREAFLKIISSPGFLRSFDSLSDENKLQTVPKGYPKDHPLIEILKLKSFVAIHSFANKNILDPAFAKECAALCKLLYTFNNFLNEAIANES